MSHAPRPKTFIERFGFLILVLAVLAVGALIVLMAPTEGSDGIFSLAIPLSFYLFAASLVLCVAVFKKLEVFHHPRLELAGKTMTTIGVIFLVPLCLILFLAFVCAAAGIR